MARITSINQQVRRAQDALKSHPWPPEVGAGNAKAKAIFVKIQAQRAHVDWPPGDIIELSRTCKMIAYADLQWTLLVKEGLVITGGGRSGNVNIENPRSRAFSSLQATISSSLKRLNISSMSVTGKRAQANRGAEERKEADLRSEDDDDFSLLN